MQDKIGKIWRVTLHNGHIFAAKLIEIHDDTLVFENSKGDTSFNSINQIFAMSEVR